MFDELKNASPFELLSQLTIFLALIGSLLAEFFGVGPLVPLVSFINQLQAGFFVKIFGGEPTYKPLLTLALIIIASCIPFLIYKKISDDADFFPEDYKTFPFKEGDLLSSQRDDGKYSVNKILKIDKIVLKVGDSIGIQSQTFTATSKDFLLVVSSAYGVAEFNSLGKAKQAAKEGSWKMKIGHVPNRPPGAAAGQTLIGYSPVKEEELVGYRVWREAFDKGEAGIY